MGVYGAYLLGPNDPLTNTFNSGWNLTGVLNQYTGASKFVAIASGGMGTDDKGTECDFLYALDDTGSVWTFWYDGTGRISYSVYSSTLTGLDYPTESGAKTVLWFCPRMAKHAVFLLFYRHNQRDLCVAVDAEQQ